MELITSRDLIRGVAERWRRAYEGTHYWDGDRDAKWDALKAMDVETATPKQVDDIIGNSSWTCPPACGECEARGHDVSIIMLGDEPDYDSATAYICLPCLDRAMELVSQ